MKYCTSCGKQLSDDVRFCGYCGATLQAEATQEEPLTANDLIGKNETAVTVFSEDQLKAVMSGSEKTFSISGNNVTIPKALDLYNSCRRFCKKLAKDCTDQAIIEYKMTVTNFDLFVQRFMSIYDKHLMILAQNAAQLLMAAGIFTETADSIIQQQKKTFHLAIDDYNSVLSTYNEILASGKQAMGKITDNARSYSHEHSNPYESKLMSSLWGGVIDKVYDSIETSGTADFSKKQKAELFAKFQPENLFNRVYLDYSNLHLIVVQIMIQNGLDIYFPNKEKQQKANTIYQGLVSTAYPQEHFLSACSELILTFPYNPDYYKLIEKRISPTEARTLTDYFGMTDYTIKQYTSADFPPTEQQNPSTGSSAARSKQPESQGVFGNITSAVGSMDTDQIKDTLKNVGKKALSGSLTKGLFGGKGFGKK